MSVGPLEVCDHLPRPCRHVLAVKRDPLMGGARDVEVGWRHARHDTVGSGAKKSPSRWTGPKRSRSYRHVLLQPMVPWKDERPRRISVASPSGRLQPTTASLSSTEQRTNART